MQLIKDATSQKLRGAYYTPAAIANFILRWGINGEDRLDILEPSCGDGVFLECLANNNVPYDSITAVEYEAEEAEKARAIRLANASVINCDFHQFCLKTDLRFDLVIGNPPFIRYQYYDKEQQLLADQIFEKAKLKRSKQSNAWVTFVVGSTLLLRNQGRMGFVIPSELLMVKYAQQLRKYLSKTFNKINIISFKELVFDEIQQDVVLLLCEKNNTKEHKIEHIEVKDVKELLQLNPYEFNSPTKKIDFHTDKWTFYFLDQKELDLLEKIKTRKGNIISTFANIEVGITTGANNYFTVSDKIVQEYKLFQYAYPMVGRSIQVSGLSFTTEDWEENVKTGAKAYLLAFPNEFNGKDPDGIKHYIMHGEKLGIHKGYKTGIREQWWVVPSIKLSDAFFLRRNNIYPKFVLNETGAYTTDTMHRVFIKNGVNKKAFIASYYNSLSFAFSEILGRNFGGGCLELMPSEVGEVYLPYRVENEQIFEHIDELLRAKATAEQILDFTDDFILCQGMGLSAEEVRLARSIWHKIVNRRLNR
ncbi:class I SAM-dependent methyltransferase [Porphyromonas endodontalis]|uniref:class I SAM-dependent methyltransferase n=1 Tax=Porphyromonas endodontalis TaxID=28124 RepID=UPI0028E67EBE|nr:class I SAM-dependent methyltransferase [Porphyromonas endodontalis]